MKTLSRRLMVALPIAAIVTAGVIVAPRVGAENKPPLTEDQAAEAGLATAIFAGGCFWCVESDFDKVEGVVETLSGYTGGALDSPTYQDVTYTETGHFEAVRVRYDPDIVDYETLVEVFFRTVDPTDDGGQFCDRGSSYRTAIFVAGAAEREIAETEKREAAVAISDQIVTPVLDAGTFWPAEDFHQDYYLRNANSYSFYRWRCGRDATVESIWGLEPADTIKQINKRLVSG
ncbi:MAG: peptide-methionine (S)-S-oxide reductase MsrA [Pseudomonadota bacterium]